MNLCTKSLSVWFGLSALALAACGSSVEVDDETGETDETEAPSTSAAGPSTTVGPGSGQTTGAGAGGAGDGGAGTGGAGDGGAGGGAAPSEVCEAMQWIVLHNPWFVDAGGDATWSAGESAMLGVTMSNDSFSDNFFYPGVTVTTDHPGVTGGGDTLFGINGAASIPLNVWLDADATVPPGTDVTITLTASSLNEPCTGLSSTSIVLTVQ